MRTNFEARLGQQENGARGQGSGDRLWMRSISLESALATWRLVDARCRVDAGDPRRARLRIELDYALVQSDAGHRRRREPRRQRLQKAAALASNAASIVS